MAEAEGHGSEGEGFVTLEEKDDSVSHPLLRNPQDGGADAQTGADDGDTSAPQELELGPARRGHSGGRRHHECHICCERFDSGDERRVTSLNCNHTLCHHCVAGIMRQARDPGRLQCPFCRQTTPFPQWEIRRLQEESYSSSASEAVPVTTPGPEPHAVGSSPLGYCASCVDGEPRWMQLLFVCFAIITPLLLCLLILGCFLYLAVPDIIRSVLFRKV